MMRKQVVICKRCNGVGELYFTTTDFLDFKLESKPCPACNGTGRMVEVISIRLLTMDEYDKQYKSVGEHSCQPRKSGL